MRLSQSVLSALAATCLLAACGGDSDNNDAEGGVPARSLFAPTAASPVVPFPIDLFFSDATNMATGLTQDTTLNLPNDPASPNPLVTALNRLDGFSTSATLFTDLALNAISIDSANAGGVLVINTGTGMPLAPGVDYDVVQSSVIQGRTRLLIRPLQPLQPGTTYVVVLTDTLTTQTGLPILRSSAFEATASPDPVGSENNPAPAGATPTQIATLELIRTRLIRPIFDRLIDGTPDPTPGLDGDNVVLTWSFTTQSISESLASVNADAPRVPPALGVADTQATSGTFGDPTNAVRIYSGSMNLPSFLDLPSQMNPAAPLTTFWTADETRPSDGNSTLPNGQGGVLPCAFFQPSVSTTRCFPVPEVKATQTVPVLVLVPNNNAPDAPVAPDGGWPVVIFQHGITRNRADALAVAPALAQAGFVTVAIDLPLHGITPQSPAMGLRSTMVPERTFDLDLGPTMVGDAGACDQDTAILGGAAPAPDGTTDCSGAYFVNPGGLLTSRDNLRQAVADLIQLAAALQADSIAVANGPAIDLDSGNIQYAGHSLGGIVGTTFLGVSDAVNAATLGMPGSGIPGLLDGSAAFGADLADGLAGLAPEGTDTYETYIRFAQTILDSGDPINYAAQAAAGHPVHLVEIIGGANGGNNPPDLVVPNFVVRNAGENDVCPASASLLPFLDTVCEDRVLSGTDPLVAQMGLDSLEIMPPYAAPDAQVGADTAVRFTGGHHGSFITPTTAGTPGVTEANAFQTFCEIQGQMAGFLGKAAAGLPEDSLSIPVGVTPCALPQ